MGQTRAILHGGILELYCMGILELCCMGHTRAILHGTY